MRFAFDDPCRLVQMFQQVLVCSCVKCDVLQSVVSVSSFAALNADLFGPD